uniref:WWE domain-containing protein n=1 Tax=Heterorhabditis bacteriophora TaxID=37862 RepID=A0A1I7XTR0_HETBA
MLGYELLSQAQTQNQAQTQPIDERLAFIKHTDVNSRPLKEEASSTQSSVKTIQPSSDREKDIVSQRANRTGPDRRMIESKPALHPNRCYSNRFTKNAIVDHQRPFLPQWSPHFERENVRPIPWERSYGMNRFNQWGQEGNQWPQWEDRRFGDDYFDGEESPQMRITHHFDRRTTGFSLHFIVFKDNNNPQRIVTELYGNNAPEVLRTILSQDQKSQPNFQQPQWGSDYGRWDGMNQQQPMIYYLPNQFPQQQTFQAPPFQPSIGQQNQFPISFQNQAPIMPQTFFGDNNQIQNQRPWYSTGDDEGWAQTWDNDWHKKVVEDQDYTFLYIIHPLMLDQSTFTHFKVDTPVQPQSAVPSGQSSFRTINWVDNSAAVSSVGKDSDGIDGFTKQEKFNVPIDIASDDEPQSVRTPDSPPEFKVNAWQHTQPSPAEEAAPAIAPVSTDV